MEQGTGTCRSIVMLAASAVAAACLTLGCSSSRTNAPTASATLVAAIPPPTPSVVFPVAPASHDEPVWDFVRQWQGANISPILRPAVLPPGLDTLTIGQVPAKVDPYFLFVTYAGPGKQLSIEAGGINPDYGDSQQMVTVRGHDAALAISSDGVWVSWTEPGIWVPDDRSPAYDHIKYGVFARGLTQQELLQVAESMTPLGP